MSETGRNLYLGKRWFAGQVARAGESGIVATSFINADEKSIDAGRFVALGDKTGTCRHLKANTDNVLGVVIALGITHAFKPGKNLSVMAIDIHTLIRGEWMFKDGKIQPRIYSAEEQREAATRLKEEKQHWAENKIAPLARAVRLGMATEEEKSALTLWETYSVLLNRVDISPAPDIDGPEPPGAEKTGD